MKSTKLDKEITHSFAKQEMKTKKDSSIDIVKSEKKHNTSVKTITQEN